MKHLVSTSLLALLGFGGFSAAPTIGAELEGRARLLDAGLPTQTCKPQQPASDRKTAVDERLILESGAATYDVGAGEVLLTGDVDAHWREQRLMADWAHYQQDSDLLTLRGDLYYEVPGLRVAAEKATLYVKEQHGTINGIKGYRLPQAGARGEADSAEIYDEQRSSYRNITYTTCRPGNADWQIRAKTLMVDREGGWGKAEDATVRFKGVPVLYSPYLSFPVDERRKSGFLLPVLSQSDRTGLDIQTPYYLNLAPNYDLTLYPRIMSQRGLMLGGEFRFLTEHTEGDVRAQILPEDWNKPDGVSDLRGAAALHITNTPSRRWVNEVSLDYVSDSQYLHDFGDDVGATSQTHLQRSLRTRYFGDYWTFTGLAQSYQTIDETLTADERPYSRVPQLRIEAEYPGFQGLAFHFEGETVQFAHDSKEEGLRLDAMPGISLPMRASWGYMEPRVDMRYTQYSLQNRAPGLATSLQRSLPIASLDAGLYFDRDLTWSNQSLTQTLEPRLYYLYSPYRDQSDFPVFDTAEAGLYFDSLFRRNRFVGSDRQGDANQLTAALTTRVLSANTGEEQFRASIGQILYFDDRQVQLETTTATQDQHYSSVAGEIAAQVTRELQTRAYMQWDPKQSNTEKLAAELRYRGDNAQILNLAYRYEEDMQRQVDASFLLPVDRSWNLVGRWNYSLEDEQVLESFAGVEYDSCCWALRVLGRNFINDDERSTAVYLQLELKGLGSVGHRADQVLAKGLMGYEVPN